ncbi:hypothetical protein KQX54_006621 [Cotesia glomerata]|uniref:Uncharacterized protein n=1 Tax=Cotesia glomerata TaxID=32391 RepID=A0AAV7I7D4_COTGL|nr:hypothetical protein KQX54_006621 [Cotesia glomerata]
MPKGEGFSEREKGRKQSFGVREKKKENGCRCYNTNRKSRMNKERGMTAGVLSAQKIQQDFIVPSFHGDTSLIHEMCLDTDKVADRVQRAVGKIKIGGITHKSLKRSKARQQKYFKIFGDPPN